MNKFKLTNKVCIPGIILFMMIMPALKAQDSGITSFDLDDSRIIGKVFYQNHFRVEGTPFFINRWLNADILTFDNEWKKNVKLKYDAYDDQLIYYNEKLSLPVVIDKDFLKAFIIYDPDNSVSYMFKFLKRNKSAGNNGHNFLRVIEEGEHVSLFLEHRVLYVKKINPEKEDKYYGKFVHKDEYLLKKGNDFIPVKLKVKSFIKLYPEHKKEIKAFVKENKVHLQSEAQLKKFIQFLNTVL